MEALLPLDPALCHGVLPNGLHYYLYDNARPARQVEMRLVVRVGSLAEEEDEQGLAHFLEHMAFKGTALFNAPGALIKAMEAIGCQYGQHLNASTGQDQTLYKLTVPLGDGLGDGAASDGEAGGADGPTEAKSTDAKKRASLALQVLSEFARGMTIADADVESERAVIEEERRMKGGAGKRLLRKYWEAVFGGAAGAPLHASRMPIGLSSVVLGAPPSKIRAFYERWYRPDLMAVVVVGDLSAIVGTPAPPGRSGGEAAGGGASGVAGAKGPHTVSAGVAWALGELERVFGPMPLPPAGAVVSTADGNCGGVGGGVGGVGLLPVCPLPSHPGGLAPLVYHCDPELSQSQVLVEFFEPLETSNTMSHVARDAGRRLLTSLMDHRLGFIARNGDVTDGDLGTAGGTAGGAALTTAAAAAPPPFLWAGVSCRPIVKGLLCTGVSATVASGAASLSAGVAGVLAACARVSAHGFTTAELAVAKHKWRVALGSQLEDSGNRSSSSVVEDLVSHFGRAGAVPCGAHADELRWCLDAVEALSLDDLNALAKTTFDVGGMRVHVPGEVLAAAAAGDSAGDGDGVRGRFRVVCLTRQTSAVTVASSPQCADEEEAEVRRTVAAALAAVQASAPEAWPVKEASSALTLLGLTLGQQPQHRALSSTDTSTAPATTSQQPPLSPLTSPPTALLPACGATEFVLGNGLVVCAKRTPAFKKGQVSFQAFALGGSSELTEEQEAAMSLIDDVADGSGLGGLGHEELHDLKATTQARVNTQRHLYHRGVGGSSPSSRLPELLLMLRLKLSPKGQPFRAEALAKAVAVQQEGLQYRDQQPEFQLLERARILCQGDMPVLRPPSARLYGQLQVEDLAALHAAAFVARPQDFVVVLVGDLPDDAALGALLQLHLGDLGSDLRTTATLPAAAAAAAAAAATDVADPAAVPTPGSATTNRSSRARHQKPPDLSDPGGWAAMSKCDCATCEPDEPDAASAGSEGGGGPGGKGAPWSSAGERGPRRVLLPTSFTPAREVLTAGSSAGSDGKASTLVVFRVNLPSNARLADAAKHRLKVACAWLEVRLLAKLRTELSLVYNVGVSSTSRSLSDHAMVNLSWSCDPAKAQTVLEAALREVAMAGDGQAAPTEAEVSGVLAVLGEKHSSDALRSNSFWVFWLLDAYKAHALEASMADDVKEAAITTAAEGTASSTKHGGFERSRAAWVDDIAAANSVNLFAHPALGTAPLVVDAASVGRTVREAMPIGRCVALTLMPDCKSTGGLSPSLSPSSCSPAATVVAAAAAASAEGPDAAGAVDGGGASMVASVASRES